jgi:hypothetical protein
MPYGVRSNCYRGTVDRCRGPISRYCARDERSRLVDRVSELAVRPLADTSLLSRLDAKTTAPSGGGRLSRHTVRPGWLLRHDLEPDGRCALLPDGVAGANRHKPTE